MNSSYFSFTNDLSFNKTPNKKSQLVLNILSFIFIVLFGITNIVFGLKKYLFFKGNIHRNNTFVELIPWMAISLIAIVVLLFIGLLNYVFKTNDKNSINKFNTRRINVFVFLAFSTFLLAFIMVIFPAPINNELLEIF
ncbi:hypothetical protein [[Mycoplasma] anseris]|uniref:Uncharacterized protein n=1 Tax=[Mycoplasma] anseris TaxID=92400 RepID=A0A2Z4NDJ3_9BACT|nr:hypothetical protein [[Mycoplasma] anseris]AWX69662.1 hypothetical protein DP065_02825 [[Mycoplasma] anseris]